MTDGPRRSLVRIRIKEVYDLMNRLNLTQKSLAELAGLSESHLSEVLSGTRRPGPRTRRRLQEAFGVDFDDIFEMDDDDDA